MLRIFPPLAILLFSAAIAMLMLRRPMEQNAEMEFSAMEAASLPRAVSLKADRDVEALGIQSASKPQAGDSEPTPLHRTPQTLAAAHQQVPSVPLSQVHDVFFTPGDVFIGRSAPSAAATPRSHAPRIQANPFAQ